MVFYSIPQYKTINLYTQFDLNVKLKHEHNIITQIPYRRGVLDTTLCDKVCQRLAAGLWFSLGTSVSSTNKTDCHNITEILLKVALNTITISLLHQGGMWLIINTTWFFY
jgi:hypothetical protein